MPRLSLPSEIDEIEPVPWKRAGEPPPRRASSPRPRSSQTERSHPERNAPPAGAYPEDVIAHRRLVPEDVWDDEPREVIRPARRRAPSTTQSRSGATRSGNTRSGTVASRAPKPPVRRLAHTPPRALPYEVAGVLSVAVGLVLLLNALRPAEGFLPRLGVGFLRWMFGMGVVAIPILLCCLGLVLIVYRHRANLRACGRGMPVAFLVWLTAVHLAVAPGKEFASQSILYSHGGTVGAALAWALRHALGASGAIVALVAFSLVALLLLTEISLAETVSWFGKFLRHGGHSAARGVSDTVQGIRRMGYQNDPQFEDEPIYEGPPAARDAAAAEYDNRRSRKRSLPPEVLHDTRSHGAAQEGSAPGVRPSPFLPLADLLNEVEKVDAVEFPPAHDGSTPPQSARSKTADANATEAAESGPRIEILNVPPPVSVVADGAAAAAKLSAAGVTINAPEDMTPTEALEAQALATAGTGEKPKRLRPQMERRRFGDGPLMPEYFDAAVRALDPPLTPELQGVEDDIQRGVQGVQETLAAFKIDARVTDVKRGPVITRYEVQPAPGVRVAAIANLDRDLARALSAIAVRIEAPVPGKNVVGIEVPNKRVHLVRLRDVLELPEFLSAPSKLSFVLGKDIAGQPKWADLTKMPHLLIAGATNSGKSVCLNSIITSILTRATPDEVKLSLIDPKRVELTLYRNIPHLYHPVVVEPKDAVKALRGAIAEMDRRYRRFAERGVRNITSYNAKLEEDEAPLPYIVIVVDELADLMMTAAAEFEKLICRLAQLARATGIHLIVATQRPSVNVITGVIKANIPARIAFAVASQVDSRTILDSVGAERLIGSGDMLYDSNGAKPTRIQGSYLSEEEVHRLVEVVKTHYMEDGPIEYGLDLEAFDEQIASDGDDDIVEERRDDLYDTIKEFVLRNTEMSASMIQRKFEIGYPRAGRIVDQLERDGILSPADGSKARKVIGTGR